LIEGLKCLDETPDIFSNIKPYSGDPGYFLLHKKFRGGEAPNSGAAKRRIPGCSIFLSSQIKKQHPGQVMSKANDVDPGSQAGFVIC